MTNKITKQKRSNLAKSLLKKEGRVSKLMGGASKSALFPKWIRNTVVILLLLVIGAFTSYYLHNGAKTQNDKQKFTILRQTVNQESTQLSKQVDSRLKWSDSSECYFSSSETDPSGSWSCYVYVNGTVSVPSSSTGSLVESLARAFQSTTELSISNAPVVFNGPTNQVNYVINAKDKKTGFACQFNISSKVSGVQTDQLSADLSCNGQALESWYPNSGIGNENFPGSDAWK